LNQWALARWGLKLEASNHGGLLLANVNDLKARGVNVDSLASAMAREIRALPGVRAVHTRRTLAAAPRTEREAGLWRRQISASTEWLVAVALKPDWIWSGGTSSTSHGTTNPDDVTVPILFRVPGVPAVRVATPARTIDIAPTLAAVLKLRPTETIEGVALPAALPRRTPR